ncbi:hypothetical protein Scep_003813 [Stephania cephalantha]|uniref:Uncharacterized protein n=1 Tax=Stephania cephalantha TaxID=152367 RepID=A0AAP0PWP1_9MAGN
MVSRGRCGGADNGSSDQGGGAGCGEDDEQRHGGAPQGEAYRQAAWRAGNATADRPDAKELTIERRRPGSARMVKFSPPSRRRDFVEIAHPTGRRQRATALRRRHRPPSHRRSPPPLATAVAAAAPLVSFSESRRVASRRRWFVAADPTCCHAGVAAVLPASLSELPRAATSCRRRCQRRLRRSFVRSERTATLLLCAIAAVARCDRRHLLSADSRAGRRRRPIAAGRRPAAGCAGSRRLRREPPVSSSLSSFPLSRAF